MEVSHLIDVDKFYYQTAEPISSPELKEDIYFDSASFILNDQRTPELEANITIK